MPIPKPLGGESQANFMGRCISFLRNEGRAQDQAVAICSIQWDNAKKERATRKGFEIVVDQLRAK